MLNNDGRKNDKPLLAPCEFTCSCEKTFDECAARREKMPCELPFSGYVFSYVSPVYTGFVNFE